jgi:hypothetical protein
MNHPARAPRSGIGGKANGASGRFWAGCVAADVSEAVT